MSVLSQGTIQLEPQELLEDAEKTFTIILEGVTTITDGTETMTVFRKSTDVTSTFTTGSMTHTDGPLWRFTGVRPVAWAFFAFFISEIIQRDNS